MEIKEGFCRIVIKDGSTLFGEVKGTTSNNVAFSVERGTKNGASFNDQCKHTSLPHPGNLLCSFLFLSDFGH